MHAFGIARIVVGVLTLLLNAAFGLFLMLDYIQQGVNVHPEPYHGPIVISVFGPTALMVFLISLTAIIELFTRQKPITCLQVRFELSWIGFVVFLQYSAALFFTASYWFGFSCNAVEAAGSCRTLNTIIFVTSWAIPFMTLVYLILFLVMTRRVARRDPSSDVWRTPVRDVDWAAKNRTFVDSDAMSIASWSNKEEAINTVKTMTLPAVRTKSQRSQRMQPSGKSGSITDNALRLDPYLPRPLSLLQNPYDEPNPPPPGLTDNVSVPAPVMRSSSAPKPLQLSRSIRNSLSPRSGPRESVGAKSMASVYSVDSLAAPPLAVIPEIVRTSASTMSQSTYQSPVPTFPGAGKPKIWAAMATTQR